MCSHSYAESVTVVLKLQALSNESIFVINEHAKVTAKFVNDNRSTSAESFLSSSSGS